MIIFWNNMKRIFGRKLNLVFFLLVPVMLNIFLIQVSVNDSKSTVGVLDEDQSEYTKEFLKHLEANCKVELLHKDEPVKQMVINHDVDVAVLFEKGFTVKMIKAKDVKVKTFALDDSNVTEPGQLFFKSCIAASRAIGKASGGNEEVFYQGMDEYYKKQYQIEYKKFATSIGEKVELAQLSLGYILFGMVSLITASSVMILEDKITGMYDRVCITPLRRSSYFIQNLLSYLTVAIIQIIVLFIFLEKFLGLSFGQKQVDKIQTGIICLCFAVVCISIGVFTSRFAKTQLMASAVTVFINIPMLMLGGCMWPRSIMPDNVQRISDFVPTTWCLKAAEQTLYGKGIGSVIGYVGAMIGLSALLIVISFCVKTEKAR